MKYGACGYSIKNSEPETLLADIDRLAKLKLLEAENKILAEQNGVDSDMFLTSESPRFQQVLETCRQIAASDINVLILGESGVGKEIIARYIHRLSGRSKNHFIPFNCQVFAEGTLESELFGHEKVHLPVRQINVLVDSKLPAEELFSWMKSEIFPSACRESFYGSLKIKRLNELEAISRLIWISV